MNNNPCVWQVLQKLTCGSCMVNMDMCEEDIANILSFYPQFIEAIYKIPCGTIWAGIYQRHLLSTEHIHANEFIPAGNRRLNIDHA